MARAIRSDNEPVRARFMAAAQKALDEYGDLLDETEGTQEGAQGQPHGP